MYWLAKALKLDPVSAIESYAVWGGIPRYWELAADFAERPEALRTLVRSPMGVLHDEPVRLLLDDTRETAQASSILSLIVQGGHRMTMEIDLICESTSTDALLIGEAKWEHSTDIGRARAELERKADNLPLARGRVTKLALWVKSPGTTRRREVVYAGTGGEKFALALRRTRLALPERNIVSRIETPQHVEPIRRADYRLLL